MSPQSPSPSSPPAVVISLVLTLADSAAAQAAVLAALRTRAELELGARQQRWLPLVACTPFPRELHRWVESLPGVVQADVAFVEIAPDAAAAGPVALTA